MQFTTANGLTMNIQIKNSSKIQQPQPKKWRGYALLEPLEIVETPLLDRNPVLTTTRFRRSTTARPAEITKSKSVIFSLTKIR